MGKRTLAFALALLFALFVFAGCARNPEDIVGMVGETPIYRWYYEYKLKQQLKGYEQYAGVDLTLPAYKKEYKDYKQNILNAQVGEAAMKEAARKQGLFNLTAEQESEIDKKYLEYYNKAIGILTAQYGEDENGRRKAEQAYTDSLKDVGMTPDRMRSVLRDDYVTDLFYDSLGIKHEVSEEELKAYYDEQVAAQTKALADDPNAFATKQPDIAIVIPEGYVETARIMLKFNVKQQTDLSQAAKSVQSASSEYMLAVETGGKDSLSASNKKATLERLTNAFNNVLNRSYENLEKSMDPIREEALAGDFFQVREARTQDTHKISYYVSADSTEIEQLYRDAALALKNVGDISPVVRMQDGVCIIYLVSLPGTLPYEDVRTDIEDIMNATLQKQLYFQQETYAQDADEQGIVTLYPDKI